MSYALENLPGLSGSRVPRKNPLWLSENPETIVLWKMKVVY